MLQQHLGIVGRPPADLEAQARHGGFVGIAEPGDGLFGQAESRGKKWPHAGRSRHQDLRPRRTLARCQTSHVPDVDRIAVRAAHGVGADSLDRDRLRVLALHRSEETIERQGLDRRAEVVRRAGIFVHQRTESAGHARAIDELPAVSEIGHDGAPAWIASTTASVNCVVLASPPRSRVRIFWRDDDVAQRPAHPLGHLVLAACGRAS